METPQATIETNSSASYKVTRAFFSSVKTPQYGIDVKQPLKQTVLLGKGYKVTYVFFPSVKTPEDGLDVKQPLKQTGLLATR